ncbi:hypothetical protein MKQ68_15620 [Chitinophaga horti]|uniref:Copper-binding protein MbnP-like domain-containing protein n=1 Tax=Chitinophaga horti TaxID=2920382 RepID=A0ABY6IVX6_9BACT|nr:MbnP family protein [Chitinophaga horti]UYQ91519.1 hypothetical protein MKQ68_15620 [Chitinophaga horti]
MTQPLHQRSLFLLVLLALGVAAGCQKDDEPAGSTLTIHIDHKVNQEALVLANKSYVNALGEPFTVTTFKYYMSNLAFTKVDGSVVKFPGKYYLVNEAVPESKILKVERVPEGDYKSFSFLLGVDSIRNVSGAQTGALDVLNGMFWSWNSGYIMAKFEGTSTASPAPDGALVYHVGGFKGTYNALQTVSLATGTFNVPASSQLRLSANVAAWFNTPHAISFKTIGAVHVPGVDAYRFSQNYSQMFTSVSVSE